MRPASGLLTPFAILELTSRPRSGLELNLRKIADLLPFPILGQTDYRSRGDGRMPDKGTPAGANWRPAKSKQRAPNQREEGAQSRDFQVGSIADYVSRAIRSPLVACPPRRLLAICEMSAALFVPIRRSGQSAARATSAPPPPAASRDRSAPVSAGRIADRALQRSATPVRRGVRTRSRLPSRARVDGARATRT